jgi:hypothetical protein
MNLEIHLRILHITIQNKQYYREFLVRGKNKLESRVAVSINLSNKLCKGGKGNGEEYQD